MKVKWKAMGLSKVIDSGEEDTQEDMMALDVLVSEAPPEMVATVASKNTTKAVWDAIKTLWIGDDRVRASTVQQLLQQFDEQHSEKKKVSRTSRCS
jgi:hypothetical protein